MARAQTLGRRSKDRRSDFVRSDVFQLNHRRRLKFPAESLPIILQSAEGFWQSSQQVRQSHGREAKVLEGFAQKEAAKILILTDAVRCPLKLIASILNRIVGWFCDHVARLIYAEAVSWKPMHLAQLRDYVDQQRLGEYLEGGGASTLCPTGLSISALSLLRSEP